MNEKHREFLYLLYDPKLSFEAAKPIYDEYFKAYKSGAFNDELREELIRRLYAMGASAL